MNNIDSMIQNLRLTSVQAGPRIETAFEPLCSSVLHPSHLLRFLIRYADWNRKFAGGVATLAANISRAEIYDPKVIGRALAHRGTHVASYIFDAARDEFNDHINPARDTHASLAQATLQAIADYAKIPYAIFDEVVPEILDIDVYGGYDRRLAISMGYHLGSELYADQEFTIIDTLLRKHQQALVQHLLRTTVNVAEVDHRAYAWIGIHSGQGGGVEADHAADAITAIKLYCTYLDRIARFNVIDDVVIGFELFMDHHKQFFYNVNSHSSADYQ